MTDLVYVDENGLKVYVDDGISGGDYFMTVKEKPNGTKKRVKSKYLPLQMNRPFAEKDLVAYAEKRGWKKL